MTNLWKRGTVVTAGVALALSFCAVKVQAGPCKDELLVGQPIEEVAKICDAPTLREHRDLWEEVIEGKNKTRRSTVFEEWVYDTGAQELMRSLVFLNGHLSEIRFLGYGSMRDPMMPECRNGEGLAVGDSMVDAYLKCGEPLAREKRSEKVVESVEGEVVHRSSVAVVDWTYRYGPGRPGYKVRFENGQASEITEREWGK